ncbi:MAG: hypothetical protein ACLRFH_04835 [Opitutales bacterium]
MSIQQQEVEPNKVVLDNNRTVEKSECKFKNFFKKIGNFFKNLFSKQLFKSKKPVQTSRPLTQVTNSNNTTQNSTPQVSRNTSPTISYVKEDKSIKPELSLTDITQQLQSNPKDAGSVYRNAIEQNASYCNDPSFKELVLSCAVKTQDTKLLFEIDPNCEYISKGIKENPNNDYYLCYTEAIKEGKISSKQIKNDGCFEKMLAHEKELGYFPFSDILFKHIVCKNNMELKEDSMDMLFKLNPRYIKYCITAAPKENGDKIFKAAQNNGKIDVLKNVLQDIQNNNAMLNENLRNNSNFQNLCKKVGIN